MYLEGSLGMSVADQELIGERGTNEGGALKATTNWNSDNTEATNSSGFSALPGGFRDSTYGEYFSLTAGGLWWFSNSYVGARTMSNSSSLISYVINFEWSNFGISVRCLKD
jgi:uncharacterized protein (TIGR02145 family)